MYVISYQDFTEVVGGVARGFYERAVALFYKAWRKDVNLQGKANYTDRAKFLGSCYIKVAAGFKLTKKHIAMVLKQRRLRASLAAELGRQRQGKLLELNTATLTDKQRFDLEEQIRDMDLIILQYADDFDLYHANDRKGKEKSDYSPKDKDTDYFYLLKRSGNTLTWQAVIPNIDVERQKSLTYIQELAAQANGSISKENPAP